MGMAKPPIDQHESKPLTAEFAKKTRKER